MKENKHLYFLIQSLTKNEKGYFKKLAAVHKENKKNNYVSLFEAIDKQTKKEPSKKYRAKSEMYGIKNLYVTKLYLYDIILDSLSNYHEKRLPKIQVHKALCKAEILYQKTLYEQCWKLLSKLKKLCYKHEYFKEVLTALDIEYKLLSLYHTGISKKTALEQLLSEENAVIEKISNIQQYRKILIKLISITDNIVLRDKESLKTIRHIISDPLLAEKENVGSRTALDLYYQIKIQYFFRTNQLDKSLHYLEETIRYYQQEKDYLYDKRMFYISMLYNSVVISETLRKFDSMKIFIDKMKILFHEAKNNLTENEREILQIYILGSELSYYTRIGKFAEGVSILGKNIHQFDKIKNNLAQRIKISIEYSIAYLYFGAKEYGKSLKYINEIELYKSSDKVEDIQAFVKILQLINHYELQPENVDFLSYLIKSTYAYLYKKNKNYKLEMTIMKFMRKLPDIKSRQEVITLFRGLKKEIDILAADPQEKIALEYFDFKSWLESKIENSSFSDIVRQKASMSS